MPIGESFSSVATAREQQLYASYTRELDHPKPEHAPEKPA
jgi:hypothetical protein